MKNRRNIIISFLLCACLIVGVGYATVSGTFLVNGDVSFDAEYQNELTGKVFFNGIAHKVNRDHDKVETDEITFQLNSGTMEATLKAHFVGNSNEETGFIDDTATGTTQNLIAGVVFEIMIDNADGTEDIKLTFEEAMVEGAVGSESAFSVSASVREGSGIDGTTEPTDLTNTTITVAKGATKTVYLHVKMTLDDVTKDVETSTFKVSVVVDKVVEA
jgi:hypothetical protein